jgi:ATP/maltotriose-dependent transcriptional regulator MalT
LEVQLGAGAFATIWEHGTSLDLELTHQQLLAELESVQTIPDTGAHQAIPDSLSPRELEVLVLIAEGLTNQELADQLYIGISTVKKHINHIFSKLDVKHRAEAVAHARELKILP